MLTLKPVGNDSCFVFVRDIVEIISHSDSVLTDRFIIVLLKLSFVDAGIHYAITLGLVM